MTTKKTFLVIISFFAVLISCNTDKKTTPEVKKNMVRDIHSYAIPEKAVIKHLDWNAKISFDSKTIDATAIFDIETSADASEIILDTKELNVNAVSDASSGEALQFNLGPKKEHMGKALSVSINPDINKIKIEYSTSPGAEALQWLNPQQTAGKEQPFLFTQSQAILARSWVPVQDSPGIRFTYSATVEVPQGLLALMSAENPQEKNDTGIYQFQMRQPIPAYLLALAVGDLEFKAMSNRTGVYAEPSMLEKSAYEFAETEDMMVVAENLYGKYRWDRYDLLVLPPSFPFGGMENPRLTFATPTILAGDRSLTSLIAHELAHSWSGNLVTNATWNDFWLNEGFTVYFEQRIMEALYGRDYSEMLASLSLADLKVEIEEMIAAGNGDDTRLKLELTDRNPDDGVTTIAYDKGYNFLRLMEETIGREHFDNFLKNYFSENAFKVMTTEEFIDYMEANLLSKSESAISKEFYTNWIYQPGLPENHPNPESDKFSNVESAASDWVSNENKESLDKNFNSGSWSSHEWQHFIRSLPETLSAKQMAKLDDAFGFTASGNSEVLAEWLKRVIASKYEAGYQKLEDFLVNTGRRKFLTPLYKELVKTAEGKQMALSIYEKARPNYHFVSSNSVDDILGYEG